MIQRAKKSCSSQHSSWVSRGAAYWWFCYHAVQALRSLPHPNLVVFQKLFDKYRKEIIQSRLLMVEGQLQREGEVIHVIVRRCYNLSKLLNNLIPFKNEDPSLDTRLRSDEITSPGPDTRNKTQPREIIQGKIFPDGRNFR